MEDRKLILTFFLLFFLLQCGSNKILSVSEKPSNKSVIENRQFDVIYRGLENRMTIFVSRADSIKVSGIGISTTDSTKVFEMRVKKLEDNIYGFTPGIGDKMLMSIFSYVNGKESTEKREFRILNFGSPHTSINGQIILMEMSKESLAQSEIEMVIPKIIFKMPKVNFFKFAINYGESQFVSGNRFDAPAKEKILKLKKGDVVLIYNTEIDLEILGCPKSLKDLKIYIE